MDDHAEGLVSVPVFGVDGPLPACRAAGPPAACVLSVKDRPGEEALSLQTDLDRVWLNPASSHCFPPCDWSFSFSSSSSLIHSPPLTDMAHQCAFCSRLEKFLSLFHLFLCPPCFCPSHHCLSFCPTAGWRYLSCSADSFSVFPVRLPLFLPLILAMKMSAAHHSFLSHFFTTVFESELWCVQNNRKCPNTALN